MISNLTPSAEAFLANMERVQRSVEEANSQVSSGKRVNVASDAPDEVDAILQLPTDEVRNTQIQSNLALAKTDADVTSAAMTLSQGNIQLQAAFQMQAKMPHTSLFDYIGSVKRRVKSLPHAALHSADVDQR
jgi:flagellar hook-associated protein 3 FlgL